MWLARFVFLRLHPSAGTLFSSPQSGQSAFGHSHPVSRRVLEKRGRRHMHTMSHAAIIIMALASATAGFAKAADNEAAIRTLEDRFAAAFNAGDINAMMKNYVPDKSLVVFDVVPPEATSRCRCISQGVGGLLRALQGHAENRDHAISASRWTGISASVTASSTSRAPTSRVTPLIGPSASPTAIARSVATG